MAQKTLEETFHATRETDFNEAFWNKFVGDVAARIRALETIKIDWERVSQQGIQVAIDRINEVLGPAAQRVQNIASLGFLTVESHSERTLAPGLINFVAVKGDQLDLFVPTPFVALTRLSNPLDYAIGQVTFFDREIGSLDIHITYVEGDVGPHSDWLISAVAGQAIAQSSLFSQTREARDIAVGAGEDAAAALGVVTGYKNTVVTLHNDFRNSVAPSGATPPASPKLNQFWYDGTLLRIWNGAAFVPVAMDASLFYTKAEVDSSLSSAVPAGAVMPFARSTPPTGWLKANGAVLDRASYTKLDAAIYVGDTLNATAEAGYRCTNAASPTTTRSVTGAYIVLPDYRGEFIRGLDDGRGVDAGRVIHSSQASQNLAHSHGVNDPTHAHGTNDPGHAHATIGSSGTNGGASFTSIKGTSNDINGYTNAVGTGVSIRAAATGISIQSAGGAEGRPRSVAELYCIKY